MKEYKILLFVISVVIYSLYSVHMWFMKENIDETKTETLSAVHIEVEADEPSTEVLPLSNNKSEEIKRVKVRKNIPLYFKNACSILQVFTEKPSIKCKDTKQEDKDMNGNAVTMLGITIFLVILAINAILDVLKVKEEERVRRKLHPDGERRHSLAEFANKKTLRRESSKFSFQLFQIAESTNNTDEEKKCRRQIKPYTRGDSINSYLSDRKPQQGSAPASIGETSTGEPKLVKRQSVAKLFGLSDD